MAVSLSTVLSDVITLLNIGTPGSYSSVVTDPRYSTQACVDCVLTADAMVCAVIYLNKDHPRASAFYTTQAGLASGSVVSASAGPITTVDFVVSGGTNPGTRPAVQWDLAEIQHEILNPLGLSYDPHYTFEGKKIYHNATALEAAESATISVNATFPSFTQTTACQTPDEYRWVVTLGAMSLLVPVEGENTSMAGTWAQMFAAALQTVSHGANSPTPQMVEALSR